MIHAPLTEKQAYASVGIFIGTILLLIAGISFLSNIERRKLRRLYRRQVEQIRDNQEGVENVHHLGEVIRAFVKRHELNWDDIGLVDEHDLTCIVRNSQIRYLNHLIQTKKDLPLDTPEASKEVLEIKIGTLKESLRYEGVVT